MWTKAPWPSIDWERAAVPLRMLEERPAYSNTERAQKQLAKLGCILEVMNVQIDSHNDDAKAVFYKIGHRRLSLQQGYEALERIAHAVESENQTAG